MGNGVLPAAIFTDADPAAEAALNKVFPAIDKYRYSVCVMPPSFKHLISFVAPCTRIHARTALGAALVAPLLLLLCSRRVSAATAAAPLPASHAAISLSLALSWYVIKYVVPESTSNVRVAH
jgi:hypothetical protein